MVTFSLWHSFVWLVIVCMSLCAQSAATKPIHFRRKVAENGIFAGILTLWLISDWDEPWTWFLNWATVLFSAGVIAAWVGGSVVSHITGRILRVVMGTGLGVLAGVPWVVVGIMIARLAWPSLPRDPILTLAVIGSLVGALGAVTLLTDRRPCVGFENV